jgi:hypothetical protein
MIAMPSEKMQIRCSTLIASCCAAALIAATRPSVAQSAGNKAAAEAIFEQGKLLMQSGEYKEACVKFEASQKLDEGIGTLLYLADCYEKLGRTASAWASFKEAASMAGARGQESRHKLATQRANALEPVLVKLTIEVATGNEAILGFEVRNDGVVIPPAQYAAPVPVDPGNHRVEASAPGKRTHSEVVSVTAGAARVTIPVLADLATGAGTSAPSTGKVDGKRPSPDAPPTAMNSEVGMGLASVPNDSSSDAGKTQRTLAYAAGGLGVFGIGLGTYFGLTAIHDNNSSKQGCGPDPNVCGKTGYDHRQDALRNARLSTIGFVAGGALLASGVVLYFTARSGKSNPVAAQAQFTNQTAWLSLQSNW